MSALTPEEKKRLAERKRLARESERMAFEIVEGRAPVFGTGREFRGDTPWCAMGHVTARAGVVHDGFKGPLYGLVGSHIWSIVYTANDYAPDALPWALLALRDALLEAP